MEVLYPKHYPWRNFPALFLLMFLWRGEGGDDYSLGIYGFTILVSARQC